VPTSPRVPIVLASCCCCCRRAPRCTFRSADMSIEAHVMRLSRRQCPAACFCCLVRPTTREKCQFSAKVLACCCCCWRRAPSGIFRCADMSIEAHVMRFSRKQCPAACFLRLVRPTPAKSANLVQNCPRAAVAAVIGLPAAHSEVHI